MPEAPETPLALATIEPERAEILDPLPTEPLTILDMEPPPPLIALPPEMDAPLMALPLEPGTPSKPEAFAKESLLCLKIRDLEMTQLGSHLGIHG